MQVLKLLEGKEQSDVSELVRQAIEKNAQPKKVKKPSAFKLEDHLKGLRKARSEGEFEAAIVLLKKAKPTNDDLKNLISEYTGITRKSGKKGELWLALEAAYNAERRNERRERIAAETLPI